MKYDIPNEAALPLCMIAYITTVPYPYSFKNHLTRKHYILLRVSYCRQRMVPVCIYLHPELNTDKFSAITTISFQTPSISYSNRLTVASRTQKGNIKLLLGRLIFIFLYWRRDDKIF
jgi:hypothetical protein